MENVLDLMLYAYGFMVSGLLVPLVAGMFFKLNNSIAALCSMIAGGTTTVVLAYNKIALPFDLDANIFGITASLFVFVLVSMLTKNIRTTT